jgi:hypothetical protein
MSSYFDKMQEICKQAYGEDAFLPLGDTAYLVGETVIHIVDGADGGVYIFDKHGEIINVVTDELDAAPEFMPAIARYVAIVFKYGGNELRDALGLGIEE